MSAKINETSSKPIYLQLYEKTKKDIVDGVYGRGDKLPSKRTVAEESGVSVISVEHAYGLLCDEGYVESKQRSGFFVTFSARDGFVSAENTTAVVHAQPRKSNRPVFPFSVLTKTMRRVISDYGEEILEKSPSSGCVQLKGALAKYLAQNRGIHADVSQIIVGSGAEYLYGLIVGLLGKELVYGIEDPSYEKIEKVYRASGVKCELLSLGNNGIKSGALAKTSAQVLHVSPYRSFPTGVTANASKRHEYIRWANKKSNRIIIEDDFESEFSVSTKPEETLFTLGNGNVIYMNTFSLTVSPSLRVGYMVIPQSLVKTFNEKLGFYSCTVPTFEQFVLAELISRGDFARHVNSVRRKKRAEQKSEK
ncbi:MAG: PLP-dependent aminotransferase family protein [Clostridia bacterium]|nr:PLP-dependent aminotransferase family protein [Clostridia bacterium]